MLTSDRKLTKRYNLLEKLTSDAEWLGQIFSKYGRVLDAFIPRKKSKNFLTTFGFVRFNTLKEAEEAIADLNGFIIRNKKMLVKLATFNAGKDQGGVHLGLFKDARKMEFRNRVTKVNNQDGVISGMAAAKKSFAEVVVGKLKVESRRITINAIGNEWLSRSAVAKLKSLATMESIRDVLRCKDVPQIEVKDMGSLWVVLTFSSAEQLQSVFDVELRWLHN
ncbi:hypothetical protein Vadar_030477 [Vaccinium darrowii]|uniref:Uncharacterized protein n=1 Tax=Vaccinium darrowii TaxID=229202 RepID=A0ACB7YGW6_9ERIC|nr:hypothetical protein Vadar_030477 [Vaccinium darrowii]